MTTEEAKTVLTIMLDADGGCHICARNLIRDFCKHFPDFRGIAEKIYNDEFREELFCDDKPKDLYYE